MKTPGSVSIRGPIERVGEELKLRIPLAFGGKELVACTHGMGCVEGGFLVITLQPWMLRQLDLGEGTFVDVDNLTGEFRMQKSSAQ